MREYVQYIGSNAVHIVRGRIEGGIVITQCGNHYPPKMSQIRGLNGQSEQDIVCWQCRTNAARAAGKRVYSPPQLSYGISKAKQRQMRPLVAEYQERQRLAAWNRRAQEVTPGNNSR